MSQVANPAVGVWTAIAWDGSKSLLSADLHFNRLVRHSKILGIDMPNKFHTEVFNQLKSLQKPKIIKNSKDRSPFLVKVTIDSAGNISLSARSNNAYPERPLFAISMIAPDTPIPILGTKNAEWGHYINAMDQATKYGADISLLFKNNFLIDGDRCTPVILDNDGVAYYPKNSDGALDSITLELIKGEIENSGIPIREAKISLGMILRSSEMIVLGSGIGVCSIGKIDDTTIGKPKGKLFQIAKEIWLNKLELNWQSIEDLEV